MTDAHLDETTLNAILDGEDAPSTHLDGCASCRARLQELETAARLVGSAPPPPDPARREAAITVALEAHHPARARWRPSAGALAVAALVLAIAALTPLLLSRHDVSKDTTASRTSAPAPKAALNTGAAASDAAAPATIHAGDLGTVDTDLRERVIAALRAGPTEATTADPAITCDTELRALDKKAGALLLYGEATVNRRRGYVLVYTTIGSAPPKATAYVVSQSDCRSILEFASFRTPDAGGGSTGGR